jgi:hypothetical protein
MASVQRHVCQSTGSSSLRPHAKVWGAQGGYDPDGKLYDAVIPNYLNPADYPLQTEKQGYYLYWAG